MIRQFLATLLCLIILANIGCLFNRGEAIEPPEPEPPIDVIKPPEVKTPPVTPPPPQPKIDPSKPITPTPPAPRLPVKLLPDTPAPVIYEDVTYKIAEGDYLPALRELDFIVDNYTSPQPTYIESQIIRLILLSANRASFLHLANLYQAGWEAVLKMPEKSLPAEDRITRLTNLDKISLAYYEEHKKTALHLLKAYNTLSEFPPEVVRNRLRIIARPLAKPDLPLNPLAEKVKVGELVTSEQKDQIETIERHNCIMIFWMTLSGVKTPLELNQLFTKNQYPLDEKGWYAWLAGGFQYLTKEARPEAFGDRAELRGVLLKRADEFSARLDKLIQSEPSDPKHPKPPFKPDPFDPRSLLPK